MTHSNDSEGACEPTPSRRSASPFSAIVTGASRGIGLALVDMLLAGTSLERLFATARGARTNESLLRRAESDTRLCLLDMDVSLESSVAAAAGTLRTTTKNVDLIVNCAGVLHEGDHMQPEKRLADVTPDNMQRSFAVNTIGPLLIGKHLQSLLHRDRRCVFANLSARVGSIGDNRLGGWYSYRVAKAGQNMVTRNLAIELRRQARGIICVALHPGTVDTALSQPFQDRVPTGRLFSAKRAARQLLAVIDGLEPADNGSFFAWDGQPIPW